MAELRNAHPDPSHFGIGAPGWEEMADYALDWVVKAAVKPALAAPAERQP